ncbi:MAG: radical SAM protein [Candidatus Lokiarchaeota archaeon]|nr:radical SAM protein [Candidatus Lokiarchaeota archaeon]
MKIALINPSLETNIYTPWVPLGILYLGTILKEHGFNVKLLDAAAKFYNKYDVLEWLKTIKPDVVGISVFTIAFLPSIDLIKIIKDWNPSIKIIIGHYHPTMEYENILNKYGDYVDYCVRGEGEYTFLKLCEFLDKHDDILPTEIPGLAFQDPKKNLIVTPDAPLIKNLDELPFPDRTLIDYKYKWNFSGFEFSNYNLTSIVSSRGCPFNCSYCACTKFAQRRFRPRSPENIIEEMQIIADQGYTQLNFVDDNFTLQPKRTIKICQLMKKEKIDIDWHTDGRVDQTSQDMLVWMRKAGCKSIWYGFESANQRILDIYNKRTKVSQFNEAIKKARKANIDLIVGLFMLGAPTETIDEVKNTIQFAVRSDIDVPFFNVVEIFSGTKFWQDYTTQGIIHPNEKINVPVAGKIREAERWETNSRVIDFLLPQKERDQMLNEIQGAYKQFFSFDRKKILLLKLILRAIKSKFMLNMGYNIAKNFKSAMEAMTTFRNSKPRGFGVYDE